MPSHKVHKFVNKLFLKKEYEDINRLLDAPYKVLGPRHRILLHDEKSTPLFVWAVTKDFKKALAAYLHIITDRSFSEWKRKRRKKPKRKK